MTTLRACSRQLLQTLARRHHVAALSGVRAHARTTHLGPCTQPLATNQMCSARHQSSSGTSSGDQAGPSAEAKARGRRLQVMTGSATAFFGGLYLLYRQLHAKEKEEEEEGGGEAAEVGEKGEEGEEEGKKRISFHDRRVIEYENRIRAYSTPDKIFRYFATINIKDTATGVYHVYMTPEDFLRSMTPNVIQPAEYGLDRFMNITLENWMKLHAKTDMHKDSVFANLGYHGLISFSDYLFLLTIFSTPARHFEIAFKMFDLNGDGEVDCEEFQTVQAVILNSTAVGARHRDHGTTGSVAGSVGDALEEHFFGAKKDQRLTVEKFRVFHSRLIDEIMRLEFDRYDQVDGRISELDFTRLILSYASMNDQRRKKYFKRVKKAYGGELSDCPDSKDGITFEEMKLFNQLVEVISDVEMALSMYLAAGSSITAADLKGVASAVSGIELTEHLVEFIITLFDEDGDGELSHKEFIKVMKSRTSRGLEKSKELGFSRFLASVAACATKTVKDQIGIKA